jgi:nitrate reductase cytochrome c-type subunit
VKITKAAHSPHNTIAYTYETNPSTNLSNFVISETQVSSINTNEIMKSLMHNFEIVNLTADFKNLVLLPSGAFSKEYKYQPTMVPTQIANSITTHM